MVVNRDYYKITVPCDKACGNSRFIKLNWFYISPFEETKLFNAQFSIFNVLKQITAVFNQPIINTDIINYSLNLNNIYHTNTHFNRG